MAVGKNKSSSRLDFASTIRKNIQPPVQDTVESEQVVPETKVAKTAQSSAVVQQSQPEPIAVQNAVTADPIASVSEKNPAFGDALRRMKTKSSQRKGSQMSIYMNNDISEYISNMSKTTGIPFSKLVNMLLREGIKAIDDSDVGLID